MTLTNLMLARPGETATERWERLMAYSAEAVEVLSPLRPDDTRAASPWFEDLREAITGESHATRSGLAMSAEMALRVGAFWACRRVISEDVAKLPRAVKQRTYAADGTPKTTVLRDHPLSFLLTISPTEWLRPFEFFEWMVGVASMHEAAYAIIARDDRGRITELLPLMPGSVSVVQNTNWDVEYHVSGYGQQFVAGPREIFKLRGPIDRSGIRGYGVSSIAREALALAAAMEASQARFHANDMRPSGALMIKGKKIDATMRDRIRSEWTRRYGPGGDGGVAVLDEDFDFKGFNLSAGDSQVIENRRMQVEEVCRFMRVFPQLVMHPGGSTYGTFEQAMTYHAVTTLQPWVTRLEEALTTDLLSEDEIRRGIYVDIDMDAVMRGTFSDRVKAYGDATKVYMTPNEVRVLQGLDPIDDAAMDRVQLQANNTGMIPGRTPSPETSKPTAQQK